MRLQKYMAFCGVCSRRKAEELISSGHVYVNGKKVTEMGFIIDPQFDIVTVDGKSINPEDKKVYILLNKPKGYISSAKDQFGRKTVLDLVSGSGRVYPVGRLDYDTEGLLLITNDGDFSYRLTHPKHEIKKTYIAETEGIPSPEDLKNFREGLYIDGYKTAPASIDVLESGKNSSTLKIIISEGKNRQVRKMCDKIGLKVVNLKRIAFGSINLDGLDTGEYRYLTEDEVRSFEK